MEEEVKHRDLPFEIISNILSMLPIESLIRFKSVCKSWLSLIEEDPSFVELQLERSKNRPHRLILSKRHWADKILLLDNDKERKNMWKARDIELEYYWDFKIENREIKWEFEVVGSCNGLLCMVSYIQYKSFCGISIWNPITKECVMLPTITRSYVGLIGFGVDSTGKYKVIRIFEEEDRRSLWDSDFEQYGMECETCEIITLGESSWREIEIPYEPIYTRFANNEMVFINGALYWITTHLRQPIIVMFDLHDEKFCTIEFPTSIRLPNFRELGLTLIKGQLALHHREYGAYGAQIFIVHIWFIEINKSKGNELYQCDPINMVVKWPFSDNDDADDFKLVGMLSNHMFLYRLNIRYFGYLRPATDSYLLVYCTKKKRFMHVLMSGGIPQPFQATSFVPSLVSPIVIACGKSKKDTSHRFEGLHLEVVGCSSLWDLMDSYSVCSSDE